MNEIVELAERLGKAIASSAQAGNLRAARKAMDAQPAIAGALNDYQAQAEKVAKLREENKPIEIDDKHRLQELQDKLLAQEVFKKFTAAQVEYVDLMRKVNQAIGKPLAETEG